MNVSCIQENLNHGLVIVSRLATTRATLPILGNILITTDKGRLKLAATDLEIGVTTWVGAKIEEEGGITIPSRTITDFIATNNDKTINLTIKDTTLHLNSDHNKANIKGIDVGEFPLIPEIHGDPICQISAHQFKEAILQSGFAASTDETRPVLGGIYILISKKEVKLVATDSYRLAEKKIKDVDSTDREISLIVPSRTISELARIIQDSTETIKIFLNENQVLFSLGQTELISRLIEGSYPAYEQIIPSTYQSKAVINRGEFTNALKMASLFARESANNIQIKLKKESLEITAISPQVGDTVSSIAVQSEGPEIQISFNAKYILDALNVISTPEVTLELTEVKEGGERRPGVLRPVGDTNYLYLIMPLDIRNT